VSNNLHLITNEIARWRHIFVRTVSRTLIGQVRTRCYAISMHVNVTHPKLRTQLLAMAKADKDMRNNGILNGGPWDYTLDKKHTMALKKIIKQYGWPTITMVGVEASMAAWLIAQHADHDRNFQKECLILLKQLPRGYISLHNIAYLEDRLLIAEHKLQLYGTQFDSQGPDMKPLPIQDEGHVDERRKQMGLSTMTEYKRLMLKTYT